MIQRIQSVYLLLGAIALVADVFLDSLWQSRAAVAYVWFEPAFVGLSLIAAAIASVAIFLYKDRKRQRRVVVGVQMGVVLALLVLYGGLYLSGGLNVRTGGALDINKLIMLGLPVVAYLLFFLARRGIEHDIELVESMDRLR